MYVFEILIGLVVILICGILLFFVLHDWLKSIAVFHFIFELLFHKKL